MTSRRNFVKQAGMAATGLLTATSALNALAKEEDRRFSQLREAISANARILKLPGFVAAVVENGKVSYIQTEGFADLDKKVPMRRDHIFPVASISKTFSAVTLMQCAQEGKISMDDYVLDHPYLSVGYFPEQLQSPNVKLKHVLSHTSEGEEPGSNYMYNGSRYNMVYGAFEKVSGNTRHYDAVADEVAKRIIKPLNMKATLAGYPEDKNHPLLPRIVTPYNWNKTTQSHQADKGLSAATTLYASTGLLTTIDDMVAYTNALDQNTLLTAKSYQQMTTPFTTTSGRKNPWGIGWASQQIGDKQVHWGYGYGDSYAALLIRLPQDKTSFIFLTNCGQASGAFYLGSGSNVLNSAFAQAFFKHAVFKRDGMFAYESYRNKDADTFFQNELFSQALMRAYAERNYNEHQGEATAIIEYLAHNDPARFKVVDTSLITQISRMADLDVKPQMENSIAAYAASGWFYPDIHRQVADWLERNGNPEAAREWQHKLADSKGYTEQPAVKNACNVLGKYYMALGDKEKGRTYLWRSALYSRVGSGNLDVVNQQLTTMNTLN